MIDIVIGFESKFGNNARLEQKPDTQSALQAAFDPRILATFCWFATE
jgi:hypothetical protein